MDAATPTGTSRRGVLARGRLPFARCVPPWLHLLLLLGSLVGLAVTVWLVLGWNGETRAAEEGAFRDAGQRVVRAAGAIDVQLQNARGVARAIADELSSGAQTAATLPARLDRAFSDFPGLFAAGVAFEPTDDDPDRRMAHYHVNRDGEIARVGLDYDYTQFEHRWYGDPLLLGGMWNEPYLDPTTDVRLAEYAVPFYAPDTSQEGDPAGVVRVSYSAETLRGIVRSMRLSDTGYAYVISTEGRFVFHPQGELERADTTIFELAWEEGDTVLHSVAIHEIQHESAVIDHVDLLTGQSSWLFYQAIPDVGWSLGVFYFKTTLGDLDRERHWLLQILVAGLATFLLVTASVVGGMAAVEAAAWTHVGVGSLGTALAIALICGIAARYPTQPDTEALPIVDDASLELFVRDYTRRSEEDLMEPPIEIPTGMFIQSMEFQSSTNVEVTGYIWQRYDRVAHAGLERGFVLPEAIDIDVTPAYEHAEEDADVVSWYFRATLRQNFSYELYPFDRQEVWLRLWHAEFDRNIVLTPDLRTYDITNPVALPGVERDFVLPGWTLLSSGFDYRTQDYNTDFGISDSIGQSDFPELHYTLTMRRQFLGPFVSKFVPLFVVAGMLFALLLIGSKKEHHSAWFGFTAMDEVLGCAALFFVLIFDHAALRDSLGSPLVMYLEHLYFGLYLGILFVTVNAIMFATTTWHLIQYRDNLLAKLSFWPMYMSGLFIVTLAEFY